MPFSEGEDFLQSDTIFTVSTGITQRTQTCVAVSLMDDSLLEGDEVFAACLTDVASEDVTVVEGAEKVEIIIEDDEGIPYSWKQHYNNMCYKYKNH